MSEAPPATEYVDDAPPADEPPPDAGGLDLAKIRRYKDLRAAQNAADAEAKAMKEEADALEQQIVDMFAEEGLQNVNLDGKTIYLSRKTFAQRLPGITAEDVKEALRASGAGDLVTETVNAQTLNAWVRELVDVEDAPGLPEPMREVLTLGERFSIGINSAGSRPKSKTHSK